MTRTIAIRTLLVAALLGAAGLVSACSSSGGSGASTPGAAGSTGAPQARATVASTGASIPVNDRPTLVFVDAIW